MTFSVWFLSHTSTIVSWFDKDRIDWYLKVAALIASIYAGFKWGVPLLGRFLRDIRAIRDSILGREAQIDSITKEQISPALPSLGVRLASLEQTSEFLLAKANAIEHEVRNNDGSSLKDSVDRVEQQFRSIEQSFSTMADAQKDMWRAIEAVARAQPYDSYRDETERPDR